MMETNDDHISEIMISYYAFFFFGFWNIIITKSYGYCSKQKKKPVNLHKYNNVSLYDIICS